MAMGPVVAKILDKRYHLSFGSKAAKPHLLAAEKSVLVALSNLEIIILD